MEHSGYIIRGWESKDLAGVREVMWRTWLDAYTSFIPVNDLKLYLDATYNDDALQRMFNDADVRGIVAEAEGALVGCARTKFDRVADRFYLSSLYILPGHQGKGIGLALMRRGGEEALSFGMDRLWIGVMVRNSGGVAWYQKYGYTIVEELPFVMGGTSVDHYIGYVMLNRLTAERDAEHSVRG